jgi:hypothetical protein
MNRWVVAFGDGLVLVLFTLLGARAHGGSPDLGVLVRTALPLILSWAVLSSILRTYRRPVRTGWLGAWLVAVLLGVLLRQVVLGRPVLSWSTATFVLVSLGGTGVLLMGWRAFAAYLEARLGPVGGP